MDAQTEAVRSLKAAGVEAAVEALKDLKIEAGGVAAREEMRHAMVNTLKRRLYYTPSSKIYRCVAGLYDYGLPGYTFKSNLLAFWRQIYTTRISSYQGVLDDSLQPDASFVSWHTWDIYALVEKHDVFKQRINANGKVISTKQDAVGGMKGQQIDPDRREEPGDGDGRTRHGWRIGDGQGRAGG